MPESQLTDKTLIMLVGPTAVGKSTIMNKVVELDSRFGRVSGFTTRSRRPNDEPGLYRYLTLSDVDTLITAKQVVQYVSNPANNQIYGTQLSDYSSTYNMKDTLSGAVEPFLELPFHDHKVISVTVPLERWEQWLDSRHPRGSTERTNRLKEAQASLEWSLAQTRNHSWVVNHPGNISESAQALIATVLHGNPVKTPDEPQIMLQRIHDLLSYE